MAEFKFTEADKNTSAKKSGGSGGKTGTIVFAVVIIVILLMVLFNCFTIVQEGFIGVKYQFGRIIEDDLSAGLNFRIPFVEGYRKSISVTRSTPLLPTHTPAIPRA